MEIVKSKSFKKAIIVLKILDDKRLLVVDKETTVRMMDKDTFELSDGFKAKILHKYYKTNVVAFSNDGQYFASLTSDAKESRLFSAKTKKLISKVDRHQGEASCVGIDPLDRYMFSCGDDGKTFAVDIKSGKLVFILPSHVDTINDISFTKNGNWVAICSYDRKITLFSLVTMTPKPKLKAHAAPVMKVRFLTKNRLVSFDKNSSVIIWNIYSGKIIERLQGVHDTVVQMTTSKDDKFLFLGTALGYVLVYDLDSYELLAPRYIKITSPITGLEFDEEHNHLMVATEDGFIMYYYIYEGEKVLQELLKLKEFDSLQKEAEKNPILKYTQIYDLMSNFWENTLAKAKIALQNGDKAKALLLFKSFEKIPSKNSIIQKTIQDYAEYEKFANFAKSGKFNLAYGLANSYPVYKESKLYKALEERWKKVLVQAQKYILNPREAAKAQEILKPYRGISQKTKLIQELLTKSEVYKRFRDALGQKDFTICSELIKQHKFLKELPEYDILNRYADNLYFKSQQLIHDGDDFKAIKMLRQLAAFEDFREDVTELLKTIEMKQKFLHAIEDENYEFAYDTMAKYEEFEELPEGKKLQERWYKAQLLANSHAVNGDARGVEEALSDFMHITSKTMAIATVFAWCYMVQLEDHARAGASQKEIEEGIKHYMLNFGLQEQIESFYTLFKTKYPESKLTLEHLTQGSMSMWRPAMITRSILEKT
jgi:WD40 repeat protein